MKTKHTPAPWRADYTHPGSKGICYINSDHAHLGSTGDIATLYNADPAGTEPWEVENAANAQLIAAAPDLLEALAALLPEMKHEVGNICARFQNAENAAMVADALRQKITAAEKAIAKATGHGGAYGN